MIDQSNGFALCRSCDPPRLVPEAGAVAHLFEFHIASASDIESVSITAGKTCTPEECAYENFVCPNGCLESVEVDV